MIKIEIIPLCMFLIKKHVFSYFGQAQTYQNKSDPLCRGKGKLNNSVTTLWSWHRIKGIFNLYKRILVIKQATLSIQKIIPLDPLYLISIHLIIQSCHFLHFTTQHRHALLYYTKSQIFLSTLHPLRIWVYAFRWMSAFSNQCCHTICSFFVYSLKNDNMWRNALRRLLSFLRL